MNGEEGDESVHIGGKVSRWWFVAVVRWTRAVSCSLALRGSSGGFSAFGGMIIGMKAPVDKYRFEMVSLHRTQSRRWDNFLKFHS